MKISLNTPKSQPPLENAQGIARFPIPTKQLNDKKIPCQQFLVLALESIYTIGKNVKVYYLREIDVKR